MPFREPHSGVDDVTAKPIVQRRCGSDFDGLLEAALGAAFLAARMLEIHLDALLVAVQAHEVRFEFIINLKTAKALGVAVPQLILARADEIIK